MDAVGQMPERNIGDVVAAYAVGRAFTDEIIAGIGNPLDLVDDILLRPDVLEIGTVLDRCPGNAVDCPHQI